VKRGQAFLSIVAGLLLALMAGAAMAVEEAKFEVVEQDGNFELRDYAPQIVAEVVVDGEFSSAGNRAFRPLFNYIPGDNTAQAKIAMTAPVGQAAASDAQGEKIAMTTPVGQRPESGGWAVSFMMPAGYTMDTIPTPTNPAVQLREIPAHRMASVQFSGRWSEGKYTEQLEALQAWVSGRGLEVTGEPVFARYNGPLTPWFMRRNEILLPVTKP
jgi:hypothetical protein